MVSAPTKPLKSPYITHLASFLSQNSPMNSVDEAFILAGSVGDAAGYFPGTGIGQQYEDNRYWDGSVNLTIDSNNQINVAYNVNFVVNDTTDLNPGAIEIEDNPLKDVLESFTTKLVALEDVGQAFDV